MSQATTVLWMSDECKFFVIWGTDPPPPPPLFESVPTLHHRKRKKKCQATLYVVVVRDESSLRSQIHNLCHSELLNTQIATKNLLNRFLRGPYSQLLLPPCRRETRVLADLQMTSGEQVMLALRARHRRALLFCFFLWNCWKVKALHYLHSNKVSSMVDILQKWSEKIQFYLKNKVHRINICRPVKLLEKERNRNHKKK